MQMIIYVWNVGMSGNIDTITKKYNCYIIILKINDKKIIHIKRGKDVYTQIYKRINKRI